MKDTGRRIATLLVGLGVSIAVGGCAERTPSVVRLYYKPPPVPAQLGPRVIVVRLTDARRTEEGAGDPMRVSVRYIFFEKEKIMATRPWAPDLALGLAAAPRGQGFDASVADSAPADPGCDVLTGEVQDFSTEQRFVPLPTWNPITVQRVRPAYISVGSS